MIDVFWVAWVGAGLESPGKQEDYLGHRSVRVDGQGLSRCFTTGAEETDNGGGLSLQAPALALADPGYYPGLGGQPCRDPDIYAWG